MGRKEHDQNVTTLLNYADDLDAHYDKSGDIGALQEATRIRNIANKGSRGKVSNEIKNLNRIEVNSLDKSIPNPPRSTPATGNEGGMAHADGVQRKTGTGCFSVVIGVALAGGLAATGLALGMNRAHAAELSQQEAPKPTTIEVRPDMLPKKWCVIRHDTSS